MIAQVMKGKTPVRPVIQNGLLVPDDLWHLLQSCWFPTSTERPPARFIAEHMKAICSEDFAQPLPVQRRSKGISNAIACRAQSSANLLLGQTRCLREIRLVYRLYTLERLFTSVLAILCLRLCPQESSFLQTARCWYSQMSHSCKPSEISTS